MELICFFYVSIWFGFISLPTNKAADTTVLKKIENLEVIFNHEIQSLKKAIWIDVTQDIDKLKGDVSEIRSVLNSVSANADKGPREYPGGRSLKEDLILDALRKEKYVTRNLRQQISILQKQMDNILHEIAFVSNLKKTVDKDVKEISRTLYDAKPNLDWLQINRNEILVDQLRSFKRPSYISPWLLMKSQDEKLSGISVEHGLNALPYRVEVLVKPMTGPNAGWIFHGDTSFRNDDDYNQMYGGLVYLYDKSKVSLSAPKKNNNYDTGRIVYTGLQNSRRLGNNHQESNTALVRVKVWGKDDLPVPDFESEWLPIDIDNKSLSYYEIEHGLNDYPVLVNVQVENEETGLISEGTSSSVGFRHYLNGGGTIWGFNNKSVRIWSACTSKFGKHGGGSYKPIGAGDGWGTKELTSLGANTAKVKVTVWSRKHVKMNQNYFTGMADPKTYTFGPMDSSSKPTDADIVSFFVEATNGPNSGYRFKGYGGSHAKTEGFGGSIFAYSGHGLVRSWPPNPKKLGHLIHITQPYGNGTNIQVSDDAVYVYSMIKTWP